MTLLNPAFMYAATWMFVLVLYSLGLSGLLEPLKTATVVLVVGTSLAFIFGWVIESLSNQGRLAVPRIDLEVLKSAINSRRVAGRLRTIWTIFCIGISFEIIYFQAIPLLGLAGIGPEIRYTDFGIPGFHGLMNAMFNAGCMVAFTRKLLGSGGRMSLLLLVSFGYPVLMMSRQVLISVILQYLLIYFSVRRPSPMLFVRAGVMFIAMFLIFGYLGDLRSGRDSIIALGAPSFDYPDWLPSAFIWFYLYLCTPLNNVNYNIDIKPHYFPLETGGSFIPSFARDDVLASVGGAPQWDLVSDNFNVGSLLQSLLSDFGVAGAIVFTLLCGIVFSRILRRSATSPAAFYAAIVLLHGISLSFFANLLFHLVFMFEIFAIMWMVSRGPHK
jgi:oligosaccharide repeat unit polymerase